MGKGRKISIQEAENLLKKRRYSFIKVNRDNFRIKDKCLLKCPKGHCWETTFNRFKQGRECLLCSYELRGKNKQVSFKDVKNKIENLGFKLISKEKNYHGSNSLLEIECPLGHKFEKSYYKFSKQKNPCPTCWNKGRLNLKEIQNRIKKFKLKAKKYQNKKVFLKCEKGHEYIQDLSNMNKNHGCPLCNLSSNKSILEKEIYNFIKKNYAKRIIKNSRKIIPPKEIDIYLPDLELGFEIHGLYWHSNANKNLDNFKRIHLDKYLLAKEKGIKLIQIFEDEWNFKRDICESRILNLLGKSKRIYARNCEFKQIENDGANNFCLENHIQGSGIGCNQAYGLYHKDELVSVMTFTKPNISKGKAKYNWELNRFCNKMGYSIVGAASKLLKNSKLSNIISYCDLRWSDGHLYKKLGFKEIRRSKPNYWYIKNGQRKHRFNYRKDLLYRELGQDIPYKEITESELANFLGLYRIYDAGNLVFIKV